jgi:hypothetical protein
MLSGVSSEKAIYPFSKETSNNLCTISAERVPFLVDELAFAAVKAPSNGGAK